MKNRSNVHYLDEDGSSRRWYGLLWLQRILTRFRNSAVNVEAAGMGGDDLKVQQYLDRLRDQGPEQSGGGVLALPGMAPVDGTYLRDAA